MLSSNPLERVRFFAVFASLVAAAGCGGGPVVPHQTGNYSNASFKGSYVFAMRGFVSTTGDPYRQVGVITSDGNGNITAGVDDINSAGSVSTGGVIQSSTSITGTYNIGNDGTGQIVLNATALGATFGSAFGTTQMTLAVTLSSSSKALLLEADVFADGTGTAELQASTATGTIPSGTFVFGLHEDIDAQTGGTASEVGAITISGGKLSGSMDQNPVSSSGSLAVSGTLTAPSSLAPGTATLTDSSSVSTSLIYYIVNSGKFVFLVADANGVGSGTAEAQTGSVGAGLSGTYAFGGRGDDLTGGPGAVAMVGQFTASGATISSGVFDLMQDGNPTLQTTFTGAASGATPNPSPKGRVQISLSTGAVRVFWLVNSSRAFFLDQTSGGTLDGTADLQTSSSFSAGTIKGQYALVMDGVDFVNSQAVGRVATLQFDGSSKITLVEVENDSLSQSGAQSPGALGGTYQVGGNGRITTNITNDSGSGPDLVLYAISGAQAYALQIDSGENISGTMALEQ